MLDAIIVVILGSFLRYSNSKVISNHFNDLFAGHSIIEVITCTDKYLDTLLKGVGDKARMTPFGFLIFRGLMIPIKLDKILISNILLLVLTIYTKFLFCPYFLFQCLAGNGHWWHILLCCFVGILSNYLSLDSCIHCVFVVPLLSIHELQHLCFLIQLFTPFDFDVAVPVPIATGLPGATAAYLVLGSFGGLPLLRFQ